MAPKFAPFVFQRGPTTLVVGGIKFKITAINLGEYEFLIPPSTLWVADPL